MPRLSKCSFKGQFFVIAAALVMALITSLGVYLVSLERPSLSSLSLHPELEYFTQLKESLCELVNKTGALPVTSWQLPAWSYRVEVTVTEQSGNNLYGYAVAIPLDTATLIAQGKMRSDCGDIRVLNSTGSEIPYWVELCNSPYTKIWIKVPYLPANGLKQFYIYYGNPSATSLSNGTAVFDFFDDMETWSGWYALWGGYVYQASSPYPVYEKTYSLQKARNCHPAGGYKTIGFTLTRTREWAIEFMRYRNSADVNDCPCDRTGISDNSGRGYNIGICHGTNPYVFIDKVYNSASTSVLGNVYPGTDITNQWYLAQLIITPTEIRGVLKKLDGTLYASTSITDTQFTSFTRIVIEGGRPYYVDAIRIRKHVTPEPSVSVGTEESKPSTTFSGSYLVPKKVVLSQLDNFIVQIKKEYEKMGDSIEISYKANPTNITFNVTLYSPELYMNASFTC